MNLFMKEIFMISIIFDFQFLLKRVRQSYRLNLADYKAARILAPSPGFNAITNGASVG